MSMQDLVIVVRGHENSRGYWGCRAERSELQITTSGNISALIPALESLLLHDH